MARSRETEFFCRHIFAPLQIVNMTLSPSLLANGRQIGSSELAISHCPRKNEHRILYGLGAIHRQIQYKLRECMSDNN